MNKKGQALVEFILVLPVFLIIFISMIDIGNIYMKKYELNKDLDIITTLRENKEKEKLLAYAAKENIEYEETSEEDMVTITIKKNVNINAPFLNKVLGNNYKIEASRSVFNEQ